MSLEDVNVHKFIVSGKGGEVLNLKISTIVGGITFKSGKGILFGGGKVTGKITGLKQDKSYLKWFISDFCLIKTLKVLI